MRLIPLLDEVAWIASILNRQHPSAEAAAKVVIKEVAELLWLRDWYVLTVTWTEDVDGVPQVRVVVFGPYASEAEARQHAGDFKSPEFRVGVLPMRGLGKPEERPGGGFGYCCADGCGHPAWAHQAAGIRRGKCVMCKACKAYVASKPKTRRRKPG
jgi:hypothetical protein